MFKSLLSMVTVTMLSSILVFSCIAPKKHNALLAEKVALEAEKMELLEQIEALEKELADLNKESTEDKEKTATLQREKSDLEKRFQNLNKMYEDLSTSSGKMNKDLAAQQKRLLAMEENLSLEKRRNEDLSKDLRSREAKLEELEKILADKEKAVNDLRNRISRALLGFQDSDLSIEVRNGKVYVSLAEKLLFSSGSIQVDPKGVTVLKELAKILKEQEDVNILVEGHTDNVPVGGNQRYMSDNWDLSVLRATSIVRLLNKEGIKAERIIASGRGEFVPVTENETREGRQKNRRTEIILTPKLDELFQLLESN